MILATWNVNNRVGKTTFRAEAAQAAVAIGADLLVLTEYYPPDQERHDSFCAVLDEAGLSYQEIQSPPVDGANRVLVASRWPIIRDDLVLPTFDRQFPANITSIRIPTLDLRVLGLRVPYYDGDQLPLVGLSWDWIEEAAATLRESRALIVGDLNVQSSSPPSRGSKHFQRLRAAGWARAEPSEGASCYGNKGNSEIDHVLCRPPELLGEARYVVETRGFKLAGPLGPPATLSDHAALVVEIRA